MRVNKNHPKVNYPKEESTMGNYLCITGAVDRKRNTDDVNIGTSRKRKKIGSPVRRSDLNKRELDGYSEESLKKRQNKVSLMDNPPNGKSIVESDFRVIRAMTRKIKMDDEEIGNSRKGNKISSPGNGSELRKRAHDEDSEASSKEKRNKSSMDNAASSLSAALSRKRKCIADDRDGESVASKRRRVDCPFETTASVKRGIDHPDEATASNVAPRKTERKLTDAQEEPAFKKRKVSLCGESSIVQKDIPFGKGLKRPFPPESETPQSCKRPPNNVNIQTANGNRANQQKGFVKEPWPTYSNKVSSTKNSKPSLKGIRSLKKHEIEKGKLLGAGAFGKAFMCKVKGLDGKWHDGVLKTLISEKDNEDFIVEIERLRALQGIEGIPVLFGKITHPKMGIVMSFNGKSTLWKFMLKHFFNVPKICRSLAKVALTLEKIHATGVGHNDLHAENIVVEENEGYDKTSPEDPIMTVIDFGYSRPFGTRLFEASTESWASYQQYDPILIRDCGLTLPQTDIYSFAKLVSYLPCKNLTSERHDLDELVSRALSSDKSICPTLRSFAEALQHCAKKEEVLNKELLRLRRPAGKNFNENLNTF